MLSFRLFIAAKAKKEIPENIFIKLPAVPPLESKIWVGETEYKVRYIIFHADSTEIQLNVTEL